MRLQENDPVKRIINFNGVPVSVEWEKGEIRTYPGSPYKNHMNYHYGFVDGHEAEDKDDVDICLFDENGQKHTVYLLKQLDPKTGKFDEYKFMLGFPDLETVKQSYMMSLEPAMYGGADPLSWKEFIDTYLPYYKNKNVRESILDFFQKQ